jgi:hypothetical protein
MSTKEPTLVGDAATTGKEPGRDAGYWDETLDEVLTNVARHEEASEAVARRHTPRDRRLVLVGALAILTLVVAWDYRTLSRPLQGLPPEVIAEDLRYGVQFAAEAVEDFRAEHARLPAASEVSDFLDESLIYSVEGDQYSVTAVDGDIRVTYVGSTPLDIWFESRGDVR